MKKIINWDVDQDPHTKKGEIELHFNLHSTRASDPDWNRKNENRLNAIRDAEKIIDKNIQGNVLEIGAGNGYASVDLSKRPLVESVHSLECDQAALNKLIRRNYQENNVPEEKYELILGSFNDIKNKDYYDFVVALGYKGHVIKDFFLGYHTQHADFTVNLNDGSVNIHSVRRLNWKVTLVDTGIHSMTGGRVKRMKPFIGNETFLLTYGDGLSDVNLHELLIKQALLEGNYSKAQSLCKDGIEDEGVRNAFLTYISGHKNSYSKNEHFRSDKLMERLNQEDYYQEV